MMEYFECGPLAGDNTFQNFESIHLSHVTEWCARARLESIVQLHSRDYRSEGGRTANLFPHMTHMMMMNHDDE